MHWRAVPAHRHVSKPAAALVALRLPIPVVVRNITITTAMAAPSGMRSFLERVVALGDNRLAHTV